MNTHVNNAITPGLGLGYTLYSLRLRYETRKTTVCLNEYTTVYSNTAGTRSDSRHNRCSDNRCDSRSVVWLLNGIYCGYGDHEY